MNRKIFKILRSAILPVTTLAVGVLAGWYVGTARYARTIYRGLDEAKVCYYALTHTKGVLDPQTREYLKGRLYFNAAYEIQSGWLQGYHIDFGPVDDAPLKGLKFMKDITTSDEVYMDALKKHPGSTGRP